MSLEIEHLAQDRGAAFTKAPHWAQRWVWVGPSGCGKTTAALYALENWIHRHDEYILIAPTAKAEPLFETFQWTKVYDDYRPDILEEVIFRQKMREKYGVKKSVFLFLDDVVGSAKVRSCGTNGPLEQVYTLGRHLNISCFTLLQKITAVGTAVRTNTSFVVFRHTSFADLDQLYRTFGVGSPTDFRQLCGEAWGAGSGRLPVVFRYCDNTHYLGWDTPLRISIKTAAASISDSASTRKPTPATRKARTAPPDSTAATASAPARQTLAAAASAPETPPEPEAEPEEPGAASTTPAFPPPA